VKSLGSRFRGNDGQRLRAFACWELDYSPRKRNREG
jgi:hypothetical protein